MPTKNTQDRHDGSVFDVIVPIIGKKFGDCTGHELGIVAQRLMIVSQTEAVRRRRIAKHLLGSEVLVDEELKRLISEGEEMSELEIFSKRMETLLRQKPQG